MIRRARARIALGAAAIALGLATSAGGAAGAQLLPTTTVAPPAAEAPTTAPPNAPPTAPTTVAEAPRARITQDTPDLGGLIALWGLGIVGTIATLLWSWVQNRTRPEDGS